MRRIFCAMLLAVLCMTVGAQGFEPHEGFVLVRDYVPDVIEDIRYVTNNNFTV